MGEWNFVCVHNNLGFTCKVCNPPTKPLGLVPGHDVFVDSSDLVALNNYRKKGILTTQILIPCSILVSHLKHRQSHPQDGEWKPNHTPRCSQWLDEYVAQRVCDDAELLQIEVEAFEKNIWFPSLQARVQKSQVRGLKARVKGTDILAWSCAGRCLITIRKRPSWSQRITRKQPYTPEITLICAEDAKEHSMGIQSLFCTMNEGRQLIQNACQPAKFKSDPKISIG